FEIAQQPPRRDVEARADLQPLMAFNGPIAVRIGRQVAMTAHASAGILLEPLLHDVAQRRPLLERELVRTRHADAEAVAVVAIDVRAELVVVTTALARAVHVDDVVIAQVKEMTARVQTPDRRALE